MVGILSQGSTARAYVMGISTAKTIMDADPKNLEQIYKPDPLWGWGWSPHQAQAEAPLGDPARALHAFALGT